jgi:hypothetical protein
MICRFRATHIETFPGLLKWTQDAAHAGSREQRMGVVGPPSYPDSLFVLTICGKAVPAYRPCNNRGILQVLHPPPG